MEAYFIAALPQIIGGTILCIITGLITWCVKGVKDAMKQIKEFSKEHEEVMEHVRQTSNLPEEHEMLMDKTRQMPNLPEEHKMLMSTSSQFMEFREEYAENCKENNDNMKVLMDSQRNQIKASIVEKCERAAERGYIAPMELETLNRLYESYDALNGNSYIETIVNRANDMPIKGMEIPNH